MSDDPDSWNEEDVKAILEISTILTLAIIAIAWIVHS